MQIISILVNQLLQKFNYIKAYYNLRWILVNLWQSYSVINNYDAYKSKKDYKK